MEHARDALSEGDHAECERRWYAVKEALAGHMATEERHLLPRLLTSAAKLARSLVAEHNHLRARLAELAAAIASRAARPEQMTRFVEELGAHAGHEAASIYPWADEHLEPAEIAALLAD